MRPIAAAREDIWRPTFRGRCTSTGRPTSPTPMIRFRPRLRPAGFAEAMAVRGIGDRTRVIAVDHGGGQFATRLWWALLPWSRRCRCARWRQASVGRRRADSRIGPGRVSSRYVSHLESDQRGVSPRSRWPALLNKPNREAVDRRCPRPGQYTGVRRRGARGGHIPGAINVPRELFFARGWVSSARGGPPESGGAWAGTQPADGRVL